MALLDVLAERGACAGMPLDVFYGSRQGGTSERLARQTCGRCPVVAPCRRYLDLVEAGLPVWRTHGFGGGQSARERAARRSGVSAA